MDGSEYGITVCAVIACRTGDIASCDVWNEAINVDYEWHALEITGHFPTGDQFLYFPTTLDSSMMPFMVNEFVYDEKLT